MDGLSASFIGGLRLVAKITALMTSCLIGHPIQAFLAENEWSIKAIQEEIKQKDAGRLVPP